MTIDKSNVINKERKIKIRISAILLQHCTELMQGRYLLKEAYEVCANISCSIGTFIFIIASINKPKAETKKEYLDFCEIIFEQEYIKSEKVKRMRMQ